MSTAFLPAPLLSASLSDPGGGFPSVLAGSFAGTADAEVAAAAATPTTIPSYFALKSAFALSYSLKKSSCSFLALVSSFCLFVLASYYFVSFYLIASSYLLFLPGSAADTSSFCLIDRALSVTIEAAATSVFLRSSCISFSLVFASSSSLFPLSYAAAPPAAILSIFAPFQLSFVALPL